MSVAEEIRGNIQNTKIPHSKSLPLGVVSLSLGVSTMSRDVFTSPEELVKQADKALYMAKQKGRNRVEI